MRELNEIEQKEFENTLKELQKKYPHIKVSEARRIFFGSWSLAYFEERLQAIQAFDQCALQYPLELIEKAIPLRISLAEKEIQGVLKSWNPFDFTLESEGNLISIKKIDCRYLYSASDEELVKKAIRKDKRQIPFAKRGEYKWVGDDFLLKFNTKDGKEPIILKTYCGETLLGKIYWFNKYDLLLQLNTRVPLFLFRHAIFQFFKFSTFQEKQKARIQKSKMRQRSRRGGPPPREGISGGDPQDGFRNNPRGGSYRPKPRHFSQEGGGGGGGGDPRENGYRSQGSSRNASFRPPYSENSRQNRYPEEQRSYSPKEKNYTSSSSTTTFPERTKENLPSKEQRKDSSPPPSSPPLIPPHIKP